MLEWLWESVLLFLRIFTILTIFTVIAAVLSVAYAWWNQPSTTRRYK